MTKAASLFVLLTTIILLTGCKTTDSKKTLKNELKPPGLLQFEASSDIYNAKVSFKDWKFSELEIPNSETLEGLTATVRIDVSSLEERTPQLVDKMQTADYFHLDKYPEILGTVSDVKNIKDKKYKATIKITIREESQSFPVEFDLVSEEPYHVKGYFTVLREDFKLAKEEPTIKSEVKILFDTDLKK